MFVQQIDSGLLRELDAFRVSLPLAALVLALDEGRWKGQDFTAEELAPYLLSTAFVDPVGHAQTVWRQPHEFINCKPVGRIKTASEAIEAALVQSVNLGTLPTLRERRELGGELIRNETLVHVRDIESWAAVRSLSRDDIWAEYRDGEEAIFRAATWGAMICRWKLEGRPLVPAPEGERADEIPQWATAKLIELAEENRALQSRGRIDPEPPIGLRERANTINVIAALLDLLLGTSPGGQRYSSLENQSEVIEKLLAMHGNKSGVSKRNLEKLFAESNKILKSA